MQTEAMWAAWCTGTYFSHDRNGCHSFSLGHPVFYQVVHVLIIQQTDQVKRAETGSTAQSQVPDYHRTGKKAQNTERIIFNVKTNIFIYITRLLCPHL